MMLLLNPNSATQNTGRCLVQSVQKALQSGLCPSKSRWLKLQASLHRSSEFVRSFSPLLQNWSSIMLSTIELTVSPKCHIENVCDESPSWFVCLPWFAYHMFLRSVYASKRLSQYEQDQEVKKTKTRDMSSLCDEAQAMSATFSGHSLQE